MATNSTNDQKNSQQSQNGAPGIVQNLTSAKPVQDLESSSFVQEGVKPAQGFFKKFSNDGVMVFSAALAYNVLTAILPLAIALLSIIGLTLGQLNPNAQKTVYDQIVKALPGNITQGANLQDLIFHKLPNASSIIGIIAILVAVFGGSRLFVSIEYVFGIIYRVRQRKIIKQNIMAILMLLAFVILIPIMALASSIPTIVASLLQTSLQGTPIATFPLLAFIIPAAGILGSVIAGFLLFLTIYMVIPNQKISFHNSWRGALLSAVLIELYLGLFPLYVSHFLSGYVGQVGFALILVAFFYYFAVILLLGAEINSYFSEHIQPTPDTLVGLVHVMTNHLNTSRDEQKNQANPTHKGVDPKEIRPQGTKDDLSQNDTAHTTNPRPDSSPDDEVTRRVDRKQASNAQMSVSSQSSQSKGSFFSTLKGKLPGGKKKSAPAQTSKTSPAIAVLEVLLGTALTFIVETRRLRRRA